MRDETPESGGKRCTCLSGSRRSIMFRMVTQHKACCSSPAAMCYWLAVTLVVWGVLALVGIYWLPLRASSGATIFLAMSIGCFANWLKNRTFDCVITGPLFLIVGSLFLLSELSAIHINSNSHLVWLVVLIGIGVAYLLERQYAQPSSNV